MGGFGRILLLGCIIGLMFFNKNSYNISFKEDYNDLTDDVFLFLFLKMVIFIL